ncbi:DUF2946 family protein [Methylosinus sp. Sm6]|uniref:DUF2946 family protein n=1 Tax=Methylosinus sp. Sm6 TaxID=2866948 RepID=UPI00351D13EF
MRLFSRVIASLVVFFVAFQGHALSIGPHFGEPSPADSTWDVVIGRICAAQRDDAPAPLRSHDHQKCVFCSFHSKCASTILDADTLSWDPATTEPRPREPENPDRQPIGWASSWSSRSPPCFS